MKCKYCKGSCIKKGYYKSKQLYRCKICFKYQRLTYTKHTITNDKTALIKSFYKEGLGTSSISRLLKISKSSVQRKLLILKIRIQKPIINEQNQEYEIDELRTYTGNNPFTLTSVGGYMRGVLVLFSTVIVCKQLQY
jgi:transposase-like protein